MRPSTNCYSFILREEGEVLHPYLDQRGKPTIGIGCTMYEDGTPVKMTDPPITHDRAMKLLSWHVSSKCACVSAFTARAVLTQNMYDALVSFTYNEGVGALETSTLLKKVILNPRDPSIREEFMKWNKITVDGKKVVCQDLVERRIREANLYFK